MPTTFQALQNLVYDALGTDSTDPVSNLLVPASLNYASTVVALLFKPIELESNQALAYAANAATLNMSSLNFINVTRVYNTTDGNEMWFVPFGIWDTIVPRPASATKYFSLFGQSLYIADIPSVIKSLQVFYRSYPSTMTNPNDQLSFSNYDAYVVSVATGICFAAKEEGDSADIWAAVAATLGAPFLQSAQMKEMIAGKQSLLESTIAQAVNPQTGMPSGGTPTGGQ